MTARVRKLAALTAMVLLPACSSTTYHIEMSRLDDSGRISRTVRKTQSGHKKNEEGKPATTTFRGQTPQDVGGAGSYQQFPDPMGSVSFYLERFGGNDDLQGQLEEMSATADALIDILLAWFQSEFDGDAHWVKLKAFMDQDLRRDLKNVVLYLWNGRNHGKEEAAGVRIVQYLIERDYLEAADIPALSRLIQGAFNGNNQQQDRLIKHLQRQVARRMGIADDQPAPIALAFLGTVTAADASLVRWYTGTDEHHRRLADWQKLPEDERGDEPNYPDLEALPVEDMVAFELFASTRNVEVKFVSATAPIKTNGTWQQDHQRVVWKHRIDRVNTLPAFCYAIWAQADEAFQERHLGRVVLQGDELVSYALARAALEPTELKKWDTLINSLSGREGTREKIVELGEAEPISFGQITDILAAALAQEN